MAMVNIKIEGIPYQVEAGLTILEAARRLFKNFVLKKNNGTFPAQFW